MSIQDQAAALKDRLREAAKPLLAELQASKEAGFIVALQIGDDPETKQTALIKLTVSRMVEL